MVRVSQLVILCNNSCTLRPQVGHLGLVLTQLSFNLKVLLLDRLYLFLIVLLSIQFLIQDEERGFHPLVLDGELVGILAFFCFQCERCPRYLFFRLISLFF